MFGNTAEPKVTVLHTYLDARNFVTEKYTMHMYVCFDHKEMVILNRLL